MKADFTTRRRMSVLTAAVFLPVWMTRRVEDFFRWSCGEDWHRAGFNVATGFMGRVGLWLFEGAEGKAWRRVLAGAGAWMFSLGGLAWFVFGGWWSLALIPLLRQGRRLHAAPDEAPEPEWEERPFWFPLERLDWVSLGIIGVTAGVLLLGLHNQVIEPPDSYYHMQVAQKILDTGRIPLWDDWSYAPVGRPHLYPPLFHLIVAGLGLPFGRDAEAGLRIAQALWPPLTYFVSWYAARWLFDSRRAFLVLLLAGYTFDLMNITYRTLPSVMAYNGILLGLLFFLKGRAVLAAVCFSAAAYMHMGMLPLAMVGLGIFSLIHRRYLGGFVIAAGLTALAFAPWGLHVWRYSAWMQTPELPVLSGIASWFSPFRGMTWLLGLNVVLALLGVRGVMLARWGERRNHLLAAQILGFLPMLIHYGGRFFMHTTQVWCIFAAIPLVRYLDGPVRFRRIALFLVLAFCPTLIFTGPQLMPPPYPHLALLNPLGFIPVASAWTYPIAASTGALVALPEVPHPYREARAAADYIMARTSADQVVHSLDDLDLGVRVAALSRRRFTDGAWQEVVGGAAWRAEVDALRRWDPTGIYLTLEPERKALAPSGHVWRQFERIHVGLPAEQARED